MTPPIIRMLYFTREEFPTYRVDVDVLFGSELVGRGHEIDFVMQAQSPDVSAGATKWRGRTVFVGPTRAGGRFSRFIKQWLGFWHDMRSLRLASAQMYDAIQVRDKFLVGAIALFFARIRGVKFFFWLSFPIPEDDMLRARERSAKFWPLVYVRGLFCSWLLYRWILPYCDHAFVQSRKMREDICAHGIDPFKLTPVPMGIAMSDFLSSDRNLGGAKSGTAILAYLGTLNMQRKLEILIEMLAILRQGGMKARLLLIGDGESLDDRIKLERRADELAVRDYLEITGFLPRPEALKRMQTADICLSPFFPTPTLLSTSPTKLVEYMAFGMPVIANDHPEQSLVLRESRAGVCVPWKARHFARAVCWWMRHTGEERLAIGARGRAWVQSNRSYVRIADQVEKKYVDLLGSAGKATVAQS